LAVTLPMSIAIAYAQSSQDADITAYSQDIAMRIARGQQTGQLSPENYNNIQSLYNNVENIRRSLGNKAMNPMVRANVMTSLTNIDRQLTGYLHDDFNSRHQMWDPNRKTWNNQWWRADRRNRNAFNNEIDSYQRSLKQRIDQGRSSGRITSNELNQIMATYNHIETTQQHFRVDGYSQAEHDSLMNMLTQLDREVTDQMHDDENSHYKNWNTQSNSWSNNWWQNNNSNRGRDWNRHGDRNRHRN